MSAERLATVLRQTTARRMTARDEGHEALMLTAQDPDLAADIELGAAWREAEAALPDGWHLAVVNRQYGNKEGELAGWRASANDGRYLEQATGAATPAEALRALAAKLRVPA